MKLKYATSFRTETGARIQGEVGELVAHLFRHKSGQIVSILTGIFGFEHFDLAEDVVQETLVKALQQWPFSGIPQNPAGWILQVAKNQAIDILRRRALFLDKQTEIARQPSLEAHRVAAAQRRDDAERALVVAALRHFQIRIVPRGREQARRVGVVEIRR